MALKWFLRRCRAAPAGRPRGRESRREEDLEAAERESAAAIGGMAKVAGERRRGRGVAAGRDELKRRRESDDVPWTVWGRRRRAAAEAEADALRELVQEQRSGVSGGQEGEGGAGGRRGGRGDARIPGADDERARGKIDELVALCGEAERAQSRPGGGVHERLRRGWPPRGRGSARRGAARSRSSSIERPDEPVRRVGVWFEDAHALACALAAGKTLGKTTFHDHAVIG